MKEEIIIRSGERLMCGLLIEILNLVHVAATNGPGLSNTRLVEDGDWVMGRSTGGGSIAC